MKPKLVQSGDSNVGVKFARRPNQIPPEVSGQFDNHTSGAEGAGHQNSFSDGVFLKLQTRNFTIAGLAIIAVTFGLARYGFGLFIPDISRELSLSVDVVGLIAGSSYIGFLCATLMAAWISQKFGPRVPIVLGGLAAAIGMALVAVADNAFSLTLAIFIAGTSPGLSYPPFSELIVRRIEITAQNRTYAWINSGTGFGVALAGPIVLFSAFDWRNAYFIFAGLALLAAIWNFFTTKEPQDAVLAEMPVQAKESAFKAVAKSSLGRPLFIVAFAYGVASSVYWTFAVDMLYAAGNAEHVRILFWTVLGTAGIFGFIAGWLTSQFGLRGSYVALMVITAIAIGTLPMIATSNFAIYASAAVFGLGFIVTTAFLGMWSLRIFNWAPAMGFAMTFFLISLGQGLGPIMIGLGLRGGFDIATIFAACGVICVCLALVIPPRANSCPVTQRRQRQAEAKLRAKVDAELGAAQVIPADHDEQVN